jgi:hypothetical protein
VEPFFAASATNLSERAKSSPTSSPTSNMPGLTTSPWTSLSSGR